MRPPSEPVDGPLLAGDIGATKTVLALYGSSPGQPLAQATFRNREFAGFDELLRGFVDGLTPTPAWACFGVAGPVLDEAVQMTNLDWVLAANSLRETHGFRQVWLINDLVANAMGAIHLPSPDLHVLNPGRLARPGAVTAVLAPGSGLGEAFVIEHAGQLLPLPSEGGHASFAPRNAEQIELLSFLLARQDHVSVEQVCSGMAIPTLFAFQSTRGAPPDWLRAQLDAGADPTPTIVQAGLAAVQGGPPCETAVRTLRLFADILADEAANLALKTLAMGGLFLGGGLAPRLLPFLLSERFLAIFARGGYRDWLRQIPIQVILNPETALLGAAAYGFARLGR